MNETYKPQQGTAKGSDHVGASASQAKGLGRDLKKQASDLTDTVTRAAKDQVTQVSTAAMDLATGATAKVQSAVNNQKSAGADYIASIAQAVDRAAGEFDQQIPQAAHYIRQAAGQLEHVADAVRERDMRELVGEVQDFARRQPTLFFGGAVILGFAALRFFKSSAPASTTAPRHAGSNHPQHSGFAQGRAI